MMGAYEDLDKLFDGVLDRVTFKVHATVECVLEAYDGCSLSEIESVGGLDEKGNEHTITPEQLVESVRAQGLWGFADVPNKTIHFWRADTAGDALMAVFLGHELMHIMLASMLQVDDPELRAELYCEAAGMIARYVLSLFTRSSLRQNGVRRGNWKLKEAL
jgi:hypothetical protein